MSTLYRLLVVAGATPLALSACYEVKPSKGGGQISNREATAGRGYDPRDISVPPGYRVELAARDLAFPTGIAFGDHGEMFVVESGYTEGDVAGTGRVIELGPDGAVARVIASGDHAPWTGIAYAEGAIYVAETGSHDDGGRIVKYGLDGSSTVLVDKLPSLGDHGTDGPLVRDGYVYFGQGTVTNSAVVGDDNAALGWRDKHPELHDIPCRDVTLVGTNFTSGDGPDPAITGAYQPFGTASEAGQVVAGALPCNGAVMRVPVGGGPLELVAWGFRNPFGLAFDPTRGSIFVTDNGFDERGSRPVFGAADVLWKLDPGTWYGWPDYAEARPVTMGRYAEAGGHPHGFVLASHPGAPPAPAAYLDVHASADGLDFSTNPAFGHVGQAFIAMFGDMAPFVGKVLTPVGFKVVRVDPDTGVIDEFMRNHSSHSGPASRKHTDGLERPIAARFDPTGTALYVVDFGVDRIDPHGASHSTDATGCVWRVIREQ